MKIVITTQYAENYGAHDWDGVGKCPQYWKMKGGSTYVVQNLTVAQVLKIKEHGIPTITALINYSNDGSRETVVDWSILDDDATVCDPWDTPTVLSWEDGRWVARETVVNGEHHYLNQKVAIMEKRWDMLMGGDRENYSVVYTLRNGEVVGEDGIQRVLAA